MSSTKDAAHPILFCCAFFSVLGNLKPYLSNFVTFLVMALTSAIGNDLKGNLTRHIRLNIVYIFAVWYARNVFVSKLVVAICKTPSLAKLSASLKFEGTS